MRMRSACSPEQRAGRHRTRHGACSAIRHGFATQMYDELAAFCWRRNERDAAITHVRKSLAVDPWYERAWSDLCS